MGINTQALVKNTFRGRITSWVIILLLLWIIPGTIISQINVPVCQNGVVRVAGNLIDPTYMGANAAPPGHLQKGYWSNTAGLTFSDLNDPNAIISGLDGYPAGTTFTITWFHAIDQTYDITLEITTNVAPDFTLLNEDFTTDNVLFCPGDTPGKYTFTVSPQAQVSAADYILYHDNGTIDEVNGVGNPYDMNLNSASVGYQDLDIIQALVSDGTCLDITTNRIQLGELTSVYLQIQGNLSSCDPTVFDGNHVLEVQPYDPINFSYQWQFDGNPIPGETSSTYTLDSSPGEGSYTVVVTNIAGDCGSFTSDPVVVTVDPLPLVYIEDRPTGSGLFEICDGTLSETLITNLVGGVLPPNYDYDWYQNGSIVTGNASTYPLNNDESSIGYNAFGEYHVILKTSDNTECTSVSNSVLVQTIRLDDVTLVKANNAQPFCISGTPLLNVTVTGGSAPYTLTFNDGTNVFTRTLNTNGGLVTLPDISITTTFEITQVEEVATACLWTGSKTVTFNVYTSPAIQTTTGNDACVPSNSVSLSLATPEDGITYQLRRDNNGDGIYTDNIGGAITYNTGDPTPLVWNNGGLGYTTVGTYKIFASTVTCADVPMDGEFIATAEPVDHPLQATGIAPRCSDPANQVTLSTSGSENGISYTLYRDSGAGGVAVETRPGSSVGADVTFTPQDQEGVYWVEAAKGTLCSVIMTNSYQIFPSPDVSLITINSTETCENMATTVSISQSETGVTYILYYDDGTGAVATGYVVSGLSGSARTLVNNQLLAAGVYTVLAVRGSCQEWVSGSITINAQPLDKSFVTDPYVCNSGNVVISPGELGVSYTLYKDGFVDATYGTVLGNGVNPVSFNGLVPGVYTVLASKGGCSRFLTDVLTVEPQPLPQTVTPQSTSYCVGGLGVSIDLGDTESGVQYLLIDNTTNDTLAITGNGNPRTFTNVTGGNYRVEAVSNNYSCSLLLANNIIITENSLPIVDILNLPGDFCEDQGVVTLVGSPTNAGGSWAGPGISDNNNGTADFDPGAVSASGSSYTIYYAYTDLNGCTATVGELATVHSNTIGSDLTIVKEADGLIPDVDYCSTSPDVVFRAKYNGINVTTNEAVFSGPGITDHGDGTATFSPASAGLGARTITLTYSDPLTNCSGSTSLNVTIGTPLNLVNPIASSYCSSDNTVTTLSGNVNGVVPSPDNTYFDICDDSGTPIAGYSGIPNNTYDFIPATFFAANGPGDYQIKYNYNSGSCLNTLTTYFSLYESIDPSFDIDGGSGQTTFCYETGAVTLEGVESPLPAGSSAWFTGNGVSGLNFFTDDDNVVYAPATNPVTYTINNNGCITSRTRNITVTKVDVSIVDLLSDYCTNQPAQLIKADELNTAIVTATFTAEKNGNPSAFLTQIAGTNTATIDPSIGAGLYQVIMAYEQMGDGCIGYDTVDVTVHLAQPVTFIGVTNGQKICRTSGVIDLIGDLPDIDLDGTPDGQGNFIEIAGVSNTGTDSNGNAIMANDGKAILDPSALVAGTYTIRYEYLSDPGSCFTYYEKQIEIVDSPSTIYNVTVNDVVGGNTAYCVDDVPKGVKIGLDGANTGVTYELLFAGSSMTPAVTYDATSSAAFSFTDDGTATGTDLLFDNIGVYTVVAKVGDCESVMTGSVSVEQYELVLQTTNVTHVECKGESTGSVSLIATGGSGNYEYKLGATGTYTATSIFSGLAAGTYDFYVQDISPAACEIVSPLSITITEPANSLNVIEDLTKKVNVGCTPCTAGVDCEGSATIIITGGTPFTGVDLVTYPTGYKITWPAAANNQQTLTATQLAAGTYDVHVEDALGCEFILPVTISANPALDVYEYDIVANHNNNGCFGGADGAFTVKATGGSGEYQFSINGIDWFLSNHATDNTLYEFSGLVAGDYTIYVRDRNYTRCNYINATPVTITQPAAPLSLVESVNNQVSCNGGSDGSYSVTAAGGNGTYEFSIINPAVDNTQWQVPTTAPNIFMVSGVVAGNHSVWVRDAAYPNCTQATIVVSVTESSSLSFDPPSVTNVSCYLGTDGQVELTGAGGSGNYVYSIDGGTTWLASNIFTGLSADIPYSFSIAEASDLSCNQIDILTVTLTQPSDFVTTEVVADHNDVSCFGGNDGSFTVSTSGGEGLIEYRLFDGTNYITLWDTNPVFTGLSVGTYQVSVRDRGTTAPTYCEKTNVLSVVIDQPAAGLSFTSEVVTPASCNGSATGEISIVVAGGTGPYSYQWTNIDTGTPVSLLNGGQSANAINLIAGNYEVTITDGNGCTLTKGYLVTENSAITLSLDTYSDISCYGAADGTITVSATGGSGAYQYSIDGGSTWVGAPSASYTFAGLDVGLYVIQVEDLGIAGCYAINTVQQNLIQPSQLDFSASVTNISCNGLSDGAISILASGRSVATDYEYYLEDALGNGTWQSSATFNGLAAGTYLAKVRDKLLTTCESSLKGPFVVTEPNDFTTTVTVVPVSCNGDSDGELIFSTLPTTGIYEYSINGGAWETSPVKNLSAGVYTVDVRNVSTLCVKSIADQVITEPVGPLTIDNIILTHNDCNGDTNGSIEVAVSGGSAPYSYQWRNMSTGIDVSPANDGDQAKSINLPAGDYRVTVTDNNNCVIVSANSTITEPVKLTTTYTVSHISVVGLNDGAIVVANPPVGGTGPYTISWSDGVAYDGIWARTNLSAGAYTFTITDAKGCLFVQTVNVLLTQALDFTVTPNTINCYGDADGIIAVAITGGTPDYTISWSGTLFDGSTISNSYVSSSNNYEIKSLYAGDYIVTVTDINGATLSKTNIKITQPDELIINELVRDDISCFGSGDGRIQVELSGHLQADMDNYNMSWVGPGGYADAGLASVVNDQTGLILAGNYTVTVNYNSTCSVSETYVIAEPTEILVTYSESHLSAAGANDGEITVNVPTGGVSPYTITWADGVAFDGMWTRTNLAPGNYDFTVTDASGCSVSYTATILDINALDFTYTVTDINCYGDQKGIIALVITGGVAPFDLHWDALLFDGMTPSGDQLNITTNYELKNIYAGTYQVRITDATGATISYPVIVNQPNELVINNVVLDDISCAGAADGHIQVSLSGHDVADMPNYNLVWTGPGGFSASGITSATSDQSGLILPGTYTVTANYNNTCFVSESYTITEPTPIVVTHTVNQITVAGGSDGEIIVATPTGGVPGYTITWDDGAAYDNVWTRDNLAAGTYTYTVTDIVNCSVTNTIEITDTNALDFLISANSINCYGTNTGIISLVISGGTSPYSIVWNGTQYDATLVTDSESVSINNHQIEDLYAGVYVVTITDNNGATLDKTITVSQADELVINLVPTDISCYGSGDGEIVANVVHGANDVSTYPIYWTGPGGYSLSGTVGVNNTINNLGTAGTYNVQVSYNGTCVETESYVLAEPAEIIVSLQSSTDVTCNGGSNGSISVSATGGIGFSYQWYLFNASLGTYDIIAGETNSFINNRIAGQYKVEVTNNTTNCKGELIHEIIQPEPLGLTITPTNILTCNGDDSGELLIQITGGTEPYRYNYGNGNILLPVGISSVTVPNLIAGSYDVLVTDANNCTISVNNTLISEPTILNLNVINQFISCDDQVAGWPDGELIVEISGGIINGVDHNYLLSLEAVNGSDKVVLVTNPGGGTYTQTFSNLASDKYTLYVYDQNSLDTDYCVQTYDFELKPITITGNALDASCEGVADGSITGINLDGVSSNFSYNWSSPDGGIGLDQSTLNQDGLSFGTYTLSITDTDRGGCVVEKDFIIDYDRTIIVDGTTYDVSCYGGSDGAITLNITGVGATATYLWTGPSITATNENNKDLTGLVAGNYTVLVTDGACTASRTFTVSGPATALDFNLRYLITDCDPYTRTIEIYNLTGGTGIQDPSFGDFKYNVSGPGTVIQDPTDYHLFTVNVGGTYIVKVSDKNNCETSYSITIPKEIAITPVITDVKCNGGNTGAISINLTGGSGSFSYSWTKTGDATFTATTPTINNLTAGEYILVITDLIESDGANCNRTYSFEVEEPLLILIDATDTGDVTCNGDADGYINLEIQGGVAPYTYTWSPVSSGIIQGNKNQTGLEGGTYTVLVRDANLCTATKDITITEYPSIDATINITDTECDGTNGAFNLIPTGGSGTYTYYWSTVDGDPAQLIPTDKDQTGLTGGTYSVVITDADPDRSSCTFTLSATLTSAIEIVNEVVTDVTCSGNNDGSITYDVIGGDGNYTYSWSTIDGSPSALTPGARNQSGLAPGTYTVVITDGRTSGGVDCAITKDFTIVAATGLDVNVSLTHIECYGEAVGSLSAAVTGGSGNYSYSWSNGATTAAINNVLAGVYTLQVTDLDLGCTFIGAYTIKQPASPISIDAVNITDVLCYGEATGEIEIIVSGGTAPYTYSWTGSGNPSGSNPTSMVAGTYSVIIEDANGCTLNSGNIEITQPISHITVSNPQITDVSTTGGSDGQILVDVTGGVAPYTFEWFDASNTLVGTTNPVTGLGSGTYRIVAVDANGCRFEYTGIKVVEPGEALGFEKTVFNVSPCNGDANGELHINRVYGGYPIASSYYRIQVTGPGVNQDVNATSLHLTGLVAGTYRVIVTDDVPVIYQEDIVIIENPVLTLTTSVSNQINCYSTNTGEIQGSITGGQPSAASEYFVEIISDNGYYAAQQVALAPGTFTFTNLPAGQYTILAYDYAGSFDSMSPSRGNCIATDIKVITQPEAGVVLSSADGSSEICVGEDFDMVLTTSGWNFVTDGSLRVTLYDGSTYWDEIVNQSPYSLTVTPATNRTYSITKVADPANATCLKGTGSGQVQLRVNPLPTANISGPDEMCADGIVSLSVSLTGVAPWILTWVDNNNGTSSTETVNVSPFIFSDSPAADASYSILSVSDANSCSTTGNGQVDVTVHTKPSVLLSGSTNICYGGTANLSIDFGNTAYPYTITYTENGVNKSMTVSPNSGSTFIWAVSPDVSTSYEITNVVDANGCVMDITTTIGANVTVKQLPGRIDTIRNNDVLGGVCQSETGVIYTIDPVTDADGGYIWTAPLGSTIVTGNGTTSVELDFDADFAGGYIEVYATNTCGDGQPAELWIPAKLLPGSVGVITGPTEFCQGSTDITFSVSAVANATDYRWELPTGFIIQGADNAATIKVDLDPMLDVITGDIKVTPYNACGDGPNTATLTVNVYPLPTAYAGLDDGICGNSYTLAATDPASINANWSGQWEVISGYAVINDPTAYNSTISNLSRGDVVFRWTVTNNSTGGLNDCAVYDEVVIRNNTLSVSAVADHSNVCDGSTTLSGTFISGITGRWEAVYPVGSTAAFAPANTATTIVTNMEPGLNRFRWTLTQNGCESFGEIEVTNNEPSDAIITDGTSVSVCDSEVTLNAIAPIEGSGRWSLVSGSGVIVTPNASTTLITGLDYGDNIFRYTTSKNGCEKFADITVRNNTLLVDAGVDETVCDGIKVLNATVPPANVTGRWIFVEGSGSFDDGFSPSATVSDLAQGTNRLVWELNQYGCISSNEIVITNDEPTQAQVGSNQTICAYETQLTGNAPSVGTGFWSIVTGSGTFEDTSDPVTQVTNLGEGLNIFRWTIMHKSCSSSADITVINNHVVVSAGKDTIVCGRTTSLRANTPSLGVGEWGVLPGVGGGTIFDNADPETQVGGLLNGPNGFIWRVTYNGCESADTVIVNNNTPYPVDAGTDQIIAGGATNLNATPVVAGEGRWYLVAGGATIANDLNPYTAVADLRRGDNIFRWTVTNMGCTEYDEVTITNGETISANAGLDQEVCDDYAELQANDPDVGIGEWSVVSGAGQFAQINNEKTIVTNLGPGDNVFRWTIYYTNSKSTDEVTITNNQVTNANAGPDRDICDDEYQLEANIPAIGNVSWMLISGSGVFDDETNPNTYIRGLSKGANVLKYEISQYGCSSIDSVVITNMLPTIADAGEDTVYVCTDSVELRPNTPTFGTGEWKVKEGAAVIEGNWAKELAPGLNILSWVITSGTCTSVDDIVIINNQPSVAHAGQDRPICGVDSVRLSANTPLYGVGMWELISGAGVITDNTDPNTYVSSLSTGKNRFRWTINNNGCISSDDVEIANNFIESFAGYDQVNCADTALMEAVNPYPGEGTWGIVGGSGSANFDEPNSPYSTVRNLDQGENILTWTISYNGCNSVSQVSVINNNPTPAMAGPNQKLCDNSTTLAANTPAIGTGEWNIRNGSGSFSDVTDPSAEITNLAFGDNIFRWTVTHEGCSSVDDVQISYNRIDASAGPVQTICADETQLEANNASPGIGNWSVVGGTSQAVFEDQHNPNTIVRNLAKGNNQLLWTIIYDGCETSQEVTIINNSPSAAYAGNSQIICDDTTNLNATAVEIGVGRWEVLSGSAFIADINDPKSEVIGLSKGDNVFRWIVQNEACIVSDEVLVVNNEPSLPYAGKDEELCTSQLTLKASAPEYGDGLWTIESGGGNFSDPTSPSATISNLVHGTTVLRWTLTKGQCTLSDLITIENNTPTKANAGPDVQDCKDWAQLDANTPEYGVGSWSVVSGKGDFDDNSAEKTTIRNLGFGENILMWTIQNGSCFSTDQITVFNKVPDQSEAGANRTTCDDYIVLNANSPVDGTGTWTVISGSGVFDDPNQYNTMVTNIGYGTNVYKWTIGYGECTTEDEVTIISNKARPYAGEDDVTYEPVYDMQAENPGSLVGTWTIVAGGGTFDDINFFNTTVRDLPEGKSTFRWTIETEGCVAYDDVTIEYKSVPESGFTTSIDAGCYPLEVKFTNYTVGGSSFVWDFGDGTTSSLRNPTYTYENPGEYTVVLTVPGPDGQDAVSTHIITVHDHPVANFSVTPEVVWVPDDPIKCTDLSLDAATWLWEFGDGQTSNEQNPSHYYEQDGIYSITLTVENSFGCDNTYVANNVVEAKLAGFVIFPDAFAPRPDGSTTGGIGERDDTIFKPKYRDVDNFQMQIFNRWGQLIFETNDIEIGWDGRYKDKLAPQAVYVYKASGRYLNGVEFRKTGTVLLIR
nr:PKD domain-containing protein [uncultured Carboxylicivirga sp.]